MNPNNEKTQYEYFLIFSIAGLLFLLLFLYEYYLIFLPAYGTVPSLAFFILVALLYLLTFPLIVKKENAEIAMYGWFLIGYIQILLFAGIYIFAPGIASPSHTSITPATILLRSELGNIALVSISHGYAISTFLIHEKRALLKKQMLLASCSLIVWLIICFL